MFTFNSFKRFGAAIVWLMALAVMLQACITDDGIPYPNIQANFATFEVKYQQRAARIDTINRVVTVYLNDSADISKVDVTGYTFKRTDASLVDPSVLSKPIDLSKPFEVALKVYREYMWTINAEQTITRRFVVEGQIGQSVIDESNHTIAATIEAGVDIKAVMVDSIKLAGATAVMTPDIRGQRVDFSQPVVVSVEEFGTVTDWTITITQTESNIEITEVTPWSGVAWVTVATKADADIDVEYRKSGTLQWQQADKSGFEVDGSQVVALVNGLDPETDYEVRALLGSEATAVMSFTTGSNPQLPNNTFNEWWLDNKVWDPWAADGASFWDTGNKGTSTLGESNVTPIDDSSSATGYAGASLKTKFVGISILGKLGAGSIFTGTYMRTEGSNGVLAFGRPFDQRPTRVRATVRYTSVDIDYASSDFSDLKGRPDSCIVWCALSNRAETYEIRTDPKTRQLFDKDDPSVIAYGEYISGDSDSGYKVIEFPLAYRDRTVVPQQIITVCSASKYGDYFTGGNGSTLDVLKVELLYDY